jgi:presenilin 1
MASEASTDRYGSIVDEVDANTPYILQTEEDGLIRENSSQIRGSSDERSISSDEETVAADGYDMSLPELLYSSSSYHAIAKPVTLTMILAAFAVVYVNDAETVANGQAAMANAYQVWHVDGSGPTGATLATSLANAFVMVSVICAMTFAIVLLYRLKFMKCLIGYMMLCSSSLLGVLGANLVQTAISIYSIPVDKITFIFFMFNFAIVGVAAVFYGQGIPKVITQGYLIATSVILAWHISYFDDWTTWTLLLMLALYDLCAVLTPCGPLKALVYLMSKDDAPEMPGLLFEAELPPEAKRPNSTPRRRGPPNPPTSSFSVHEPPQSDSASEAAKEIKIPLAIAKVYQLPIVSIPIKSMKIMYPGRFNESNASASPLLTDESNASLNLSENPTPQQLRAPVIVRLPAHGGSLEHVSRSGKKVYLERDRHGNPKRTLWVDRKGKVFAEMRGDDEDGPGHNTIRLGLGDFIFYSVLVAKAAQYSFATFAACALVILAGLGGTLVLLSVYGHALPALPISIFLGVVFYLLTRFFVEPWVETVFGTPYYV